MAKDTRLYGKLTHDFTQHPKIKPLPDAAFRCYVEMLLWSCHYLTDGAVPKAVALACWLLEPIEKLVQEHVLVETETDYQIPDFADHQMTRAEVEHLRTVRKRAGRRGGLARVANLANGQASAIASAQAKSKQNSSRRENLEPRSTTPYVSPNGDTSGGCAHARNGANAPPPTCRKHPDGPDHDYPCHTCATVRKWNEEQFNSRPTPQPPQWEPQGPPPELGEGYAVARAKIQNILDKTIPEEDLF